MPTCVDGHESVATDYCDVCGVVIGAATVPSTPQEGSAPAEAEAKPCPACGVPSSGRFCEACGHDSALPAPVARPATEPVVPSAAAAVWTAVVAADREFHQRVLDRDGPDTVDFPAFYRERRIALHDNTALIGRAKPEQGLEPEIDLGIPPIDRGVSSQHAVLRVGDGGITITDIGSTNGTSLNGSDDLLAKNVEIPLADGDRIHVGAWTTITIVKSR